jgi:heme-based aerotactic transducer
MSLRSSRGIDDDSRRTVDGSSLTADIGIDEAEIDWRTEFTRFDRTDRERLEAMSGTFERIADDLVEEFYDHLQSHAEAVAVLDSSSKPVEALKKSQREYLLDLGRGEYGQGYFDRRARIGKIHEMLDLDPKMYLGAYTIYYEGIADAIAADIEDEFSSEETAAVETALSRFVSALKIMNLDQQVAVDTYIHSYSERVETELEARANLQREVRDELEKPIDGLQEGTEQVLEGTEEIATLADTQAESASQAANEVGNLSATIEEVASTADDVTARSERADELATEGRSSAEDAIETMAGVTDAAEAVTDDVETLHERVEEIDAVVDVIDDIAEQTNLLALNASIEAARAGEAGSGFAVVADEVKSLAEDSQKQAGRIDEMVSEIQTDALETVESLEETNDAIGESTEEVTAVLERLEDIAAAIEDATDGIQEVSRAMDEQAASTEEIASMVDELADSSEALTDELGSITDANREQKRSVDEIAETVGRLTESMDADRQIGGK